MINMNWEKLLGENRELASKFQELPAHIAKKSLLAAMRRAIQKAKGPQLLRKNTPPLNTTRGRKAKGAKKTSGALRKAVTVKAKWIGRNKDGFAVAGIGYKFGHESRKAIWHEFGTTRMAGRKMMERTFDSISDQVKKNLESELVVALERAAAEVKGGKNKGYGG